jgi:hypothetical protein
VIAAYQQSIIGTGGTGTEVNRPPDARGFLNWSILGRPTAQDSHLISSDGPFTVEVILSLTQPVHNGYLVLGLQTPDGNKIGGWKISGLLLKQGLHRILCEFPALPVRPGVYYWHAWMYDGATRIDSAHILPELVVATDDYSHLDDNWGGLLNLPVELSVEPSL